MWHILFDLLLVSAGMGMGVVLMCILQVGKEADTRCRSGVQRWRRKRRTLKPVQQDYRSVNLLFHPT